MNTWPRAFRENGWCIAVKQRLMSQRIRRVQTQTEKERTGWMGGWVGGWMEGRMGERKELILDPYFILNLKSVLGVLKMKCEIQNYRISKENIGEYLHDFGVEICLNET